MYVLESLSIVNIGLVEKLTLHFGEQVSILTGETGAGKSLIISSLLLLSGRGTPKTMMRSGATQASVEAVFKVSRESELAHFIHDRGISIENDMVIMRKLLNATGRAKSYIMGFQVSNKELQECMTMLCEVYSQHEFQLLFRPHEQRKLLDIYAGLQEKVELFFSEQKKYKHEKESFLEHERMAEHRMRELEYLDYAIKEIESASLEPGEEERLHETMTRAVHEQQIATEHAHILSHIEGEDSLFYHHFEVIESLKKLTNLLPSFTKTTANHEKISQEYVDSLEAIKGLVNTISSYTKIDLPAVEARISLLESLKSKYGKSIDEILRYYQNARKKKSEFTHINTSQSHVVAQLSEKKTTLKQMAKEIYDIRCKNAEVYSTKVNEILHAVGLQHAEFYVRVFPPHTSPPVPLQFEIRTNQGEDIHPLSAIASGGELSRVMLALKSISSDAINPRTLILDEIDAGIGGTISRSVASYLHQLGKKNQVICISHNATIAAVAETQFKVDKIQKNDRSVVVASKLDVESRVKELARMLVGHEENNLAQTQSRHLLNEYAIQ